MSERAQIALNNSLYVITAYDGELLVGHARIVGDGGLSYIVSDVMVAATHQGQGIGKALMKRVDAWLDRYTYSDSYVELLAVEPANHLYAQFGFVSGEGRIGMKRQQKN